MNNRIPLHIAIIPDGNRRWAISKGLKKVEGYSKIDYDHLEKLLLEAKKFGTKYVSLWLFSTENWKRPKIEVNFLFNHFLENLDKLLEGSIKNKTRIKHFGRKDRLPKKLVEALENLETKTSNFDDFTVILCIDYGGRDEIIRAINNAIKSEVKHIDENNISKFLDSKDFPDPDLIIRTSGEKRLSGFMPYQSAYSELYFTNIHFPDFGPVQLRESIIDFSKRKRRFGGN